MYINPRSRYRYRKWKKKKILFEHVFQKEKLWVVIQFFVLKRRYCNDDVSYQTCLSHGVPSWETCQVFFPPRCLICNFDYGRLLNTKNENAWLITKTHEIARYIRLKQIYYLYTHSVLQYIGSRHQFITCTHILLGNRYVQITFPNMTFICNSINFTNVCHFRENIRRGIPKL